MTILLAVLLIAGGFLLILAEVFLLPGLVTGVIGTGLIVWGIVYSYQHFGAGGAWIAIIASLLSGITLLYALIRMRVWKRFVLQENQLSGQGQGISEAALESYVGRKGRAITPLHPAGTIEIDDRRFDAVTQGRFLKKDTDVEVIGVSGAQLVVTDAAP